MVNQKIERFHTLLVDPVGEEGADARRIRKRFNSFDEMSYKRANWQDRTLPEQSIEPPSAYCRIPRE